MQTPLIARQVQDVAAPVLAAQGLELVLVEFVPAGRILRLYVDRAGGVALEHCAAASRLVGDLLDAEDVAGQSGGLAGRYTLEVSSPGLDRPLTRPDHFRRFIGHPVRVVTHVPTATGQRNHTGRLTEAGEDAIWVEADDGNRHELAYAAIDRARLVPEL